MQQLQNRYADRKTEKNEYDIDGKKYIVTRHYSEKEELLQAIFLLAVARADRDFGSNGQFPPDFVGFSPKKP